MQSQVPQQSTISNDVPMLGELEKQLFFIY